MALEFKDQFGVHVYGPGLVGLGGLQPASAEGSLDPDQLVPKVEVTGL
jgi:hypothetical protein